MTAGRREAPDAGDRGDGLGTTREQVLRRASEAEARGDVAELARCAIAMPRAAAFMELDRDLRDLLLRSVAAGFAGDNGLAARVLGRLAIETPWSSAGERLEYASAAVNSAVMCGQASVMTAALLSRAEVLWGPDHVDLRRQDVAEATRLAALARDPSLEIQARLWSLFVNLERGAIAEAAQDLQVCATLAGGSPTAEYAVAVRRVALEVLAGDLAEAQALARSAFEYGKTVGIEDAATVFDVHTIWTAVLRGERRALASLYDEHGEAATRPLVAKAVLLNAANRRAEAARCLTAALQQVPDHPDPRSISIVIGACEVAFDLDDKETARRLLDWLTPYASLNVVMGGGVLFLGPVSYYLGVAARAAGRREDAIEWLREAVARADDQGAVPWLVQASVHLAELLDRSDAATARSLALRAARVAGGSGMATWMARSEAVVDRAAEDLAVRPGGWDLLTGAERAVALQVARGLTNRQVSQELFVSHNTVKTHLSRAFAKLQVTTRAELAAKVSRLTPPAHGANPPS